MHYSFRFCGEWVFRLRRIKTFESPRAAKFHLRGSNSLRTRYLLGYTVDIAPAEQHLASGDSDDPAGGKQPLQRTRRGRIVALVVQRHDDASIRNIEIDI